MTKEDKAKQYAINVWQNKHWSSMKRLKPTFEQNSEVDFLAGYESAEQESEEMMIAFAK